MATTSRNAPCPCGSGKRYKACHGAIDVTAPSALAATPDRLDAGAGRSDDPEAGFELGNRYRERGDAPAARAVYERALLSAPDHAGLLNNLGLALEACGERNRAEECYRRVLAGNPQHPDALGNLANLLFEREAFRQSADAYGRLFAIRRDIPAPVWVRRGMAHQRLGDFAPAESCFREAARLLPDDARIHRNLASVCAEQNRHADAEPAWLRALELQPQSRYALSMLAFGRQHQCKWTGLAELHARLDLALAQDTRADDDRCNPFALLSIPTTPSAQLRAAQRWARGFAADPPAVAPEVTPGRRMRIGFVSSDFRAHPMVFLSAEFWERMDRDRFETFGYGIRARDTGPIGQRAERAFDHFIDASDDGVATIAQRIRADRIAILIDLNGYTQHARERIFALRPAPVQINYLGYPGTLGAPWIDYMVVDPFVAPAAMQPYFSERFLTLPHYYHPRDTRNAPKVVAPDRLACGLPADAVVFCCFNNAYKILPDVFAIWMRILSGTPGSILWLLETAPDATARIRSEAAQSGIDPARIAFAPRVGAVDHMARIAAADLVLDSYPYGAHTTANDALYAGVPVLTRVGEPMTTRVAGSQLHAIGLPELVTTSAADYAALAIELARDPGRLAALRRRLAANRATHPLFDIPRFTRDFEECLLSAWRMHSGP